MCQEENDENYEEEAEVADVFDSDFDEDVSSFRVCFHKKQDAWMPTFFFGLFLCCFQEPEQDEGVEDDADERSG